MPHAGDVVETPLAGHPRWDISSSARPTNVSKIGVFNVRSVFCNIPQSFRISGKPVPNDGVRSSVQGQNFDFLRPCPPRDIVTRHQDVDMLWIHDKLLCRADSVTL